MTLRFTKMHGAGNDFVVIDAINQTVNFTSDQWRDIANRRFGIGADQILIVEKGLTEHREIRVETMSGVIRPKLEDDGRITVDMGAPIFDPERVPFDPAGLASKPQHAATLWNIPVGSSLQNFVVLSMGNPHAVQLVEDVDTAAVSEDGPLIENHACFPRRVNAGFMQVVNRQHIRLRVFERGAGETLACGTGACAAVVAGIQLGLLDSPVAVTTRGGELSIAWDGEQSSVMLTGPAVSVFEGTIDI